MRIFILILSVAFCLSISPANAQQAPLADIHKLAAAAAKGDAKSQARLGADYALGDGVAQNYGYAYLWLTLGARGGDMEYEPIRKDVAELLTPETVAALDKKAQRWRPGVVVNLTPAAPQKAELAEEAAPPPVIVSSQLPFFTKMLIRLKAMFLNRMVHY